MEDSRSFFIEGVKDIEEDIRANNTYIIRDGAENLCNSVVCTTNTLVLSILDKVPSSHWKRRKMLERLEDLFEEVQRLGLRDRYAARERCLHELTFYEGIVDPS